MKHIYSIWACMSSSCNNKHIIGSQSDWLLLISEDPSYHWQLKLRICNLEVLERTYINICSTRGIMPRNFNIHIVSRKGLILLNNNLVFQNYILYLPFWSLKCASCAQFFYQGLLLFGLNLSAHAEHRYTVCWNVSL